MHFERLANELAGRLDFEVTILDRDDEIGSDDFIITGSDTLEQLLNRTEDSKLLSKRCLLVDVPREYALEMAESQELAGVVDGAVYSQWKIQYPHAEAALFALRTLLPRLSGSISGLARETGANYQRITARNAHSLSEFLAEYIQVLLTLF